LHVGTLTNEAPGARFAVWGVKPRNPQSNRKKILGGNKMMAVLLSGLPQCEQKLFFLETLAEGHTTRGKRGPFPNASDCVSGRMETVCFEIRLHWFNQLIDV
jgi:hypothetical protein